jgi:hypothetical protein
MMKPEKSVKSHAPSGGVVFAESVSDILERERQHVISDWLSRVDQEPDLMCVPLSY